MEIKIDKFNKEWIQKIKYIWQYTETATEIVAFLFNWFFFSGDFFYNDCLT